ncbi:hypothetical protein LTR16_001386 [Cryomyces antarcticus]|uniref:Tudor domain-containing protein n=1 Tax=Cryomyces antarcticus TaxID=329879 RepID=A0ABR0M8G8_9PEZI|nr:hypothetical protein LTR16_001386 [Cryomyces antarcticus]
MVSDVATLEAEVKTYKAQLESTISQLQSEPDNEALLPLKSDLEDLIRTLEDDISAVKTAEAAAAAAAPPPAKEKWSKENHPAYKAGYRPPGATQSPVVPEPQAPVVFKVNDTVSAKWQADKSFYPAKITSITGSSAAPIYIVTFKGYGDTATLSGADIRPLAGTKRKADGSPTHPTATTPSATNTTGVISAAANINPALASQARADASAATDTAKPTKGVKKIRANKELEAGKSKWQEFSTKGKMGKATGLKKKESMFRTPEGPNARVGVTGSGQAMRKDAARSRHVYAPAEDDGY